MENACGIAWPMAMETESTITRAITGIHETTHTSSLSVCLLSPNALLMKVHSYPQPLPRVTHSSDS